MGGRRACHHHAARHPSSRELARWCTTGTTESARRQAFGHGGVDKRIDVLGYELRGGLRCTISDLSYAPLFSQPTIR